MTYYAPITNLLSTDELAALGEVAANSAELENLIVWQTMCILQVTLKQAKTITNELDCPKVDFLAKIAASTLTEDEPKQTFATWLSRARIAIGERNTVIHGNWSADSTGLPLGESLDMELGLKPPVGVKASNTRNHNRKVKAEDLRRVASDLYQLRIDLWDIGQNNWWKGWNEAVFKVKGWDAIHWAD